MSQDGWPRRLSAIASKALATGMLIVIPDYAHAETPCIELVPTADCIDLYDSADKPLNHECVPKDKLGKLCQIGEKPGFYHVQLGTSLVWIQTWQLSMSVSSPPVAPPPLSREFWHRAGPTAELWKENRGIADYNKAIELMPDDAEAYSNRGGAYLAKGLAIADYREALKHTRGVDRKVYDQANAEAYDQAIADYSKAIELKPGYADAYHNRGTAYFAKGLDDQAIADFNKAIELKPDYAEAYNIRGVAYDRKGLHDQAIADFNKAASAYNARARDYHLAGQDSQGLHDAILAVSLAPKNAGVFETRAEIYEKLGQRDNAIADYRQSYRSTPI